MYWRLINQYPLSYRIFPAVPKVQFLKWALNFLGSSLCHDLLPADCAVQDSIFSRFSISVKEREWRRSERTRTGRIIAGLPEEDTVTMCTDHSPAARRWGRI